MLVTSTYSRRSIYFLCNTALETEKTTQDERNQNNILMLWLKTEFVNSSYSLISLIPFLAEIAIIT